MGEEKRMDAPSLQAKAALWVGLVNSGGLLVLGAYCLKGAVDHIYPVAALAAWVLAMPFLVWGGRSG